MLNYKFATLGNYKGPEKAFTECETLLEARFPFCMIAEKECIDAVKNLDINKPTGHSSIPAWALQDGISEIYPHLSFFVNAFFKENKFLSSLKTTEVIPAYKKEDKLEPTKYRPISITPVLSKVFERILLD